MWVIVTKSSQFPNLTTKATKPSSLMSKLASTRLTHDLQILPLTLVEKILEYKHVTVLRLTMDEYYDSEKQRVKDVKMMKHLFGYLGRDSMRKVFLVWVNLDIMNIDMPRLSLIRSLSPWKYVKRYRFVNCNESNMNYVCIHANLSSSN